MKKKYRRKYLEKLQININIFSIFIFEKTFKGKGLLLIEKKSYGLLHINNTNTKETKSFTSKKF